MLQQVYEFERRASVVTVVEEPYLVAECGLVRTVQCISHAVAFRLLHRTGWTIGASCAAAAAMTHTD